MGISNGAVIVIAIVVAGFVVITGAVIFKFQAGRGAADGEGDGEYYNQRSNDQEHYMREVRERNRAWNQYEARYGDRFGTTMTGAPSTISGTNVYSSHV
ncbi:uncharacterized protein AB675_9537 [Cyphellophora attinorum]|uniref:Uncharacterized protein n=1 Tax=Cyphellophora attinorum TaxID=1664694 RepID=A0A0N1P0B5_9EURO|nr:uncharacterized protein AB675_9537 [Phialophora attinorum]KPI42436.1 hypothetical protein AB675_9537 [Phialophora attinorum]